VSFNTATSFNHKLSPPPLIAVFGGGVDAKPVVAIAFEMGWQVLLIDPRVGYAKTEHFPTALSIEKGAIESLASKSWLQQISVAFVLTHNIKLDGQAVSLLQNSSARYVGLLGPRHRTERVLDTAGISFQDLQKPLANPVGLKLGGELPESIALSMLAEAQGYLEGGNGASFSGLIG
jgi:xanthine dehydrogenase accessory factor